MTGVADAVETNVMGSVHALLKGTRQSGVSVMLAGHIDEIGLMVNYITPEGFIAFAAIGGVDAAILPGMRVDVHTTDGPLLGVMGRKPIHLIEDDERKNVTKLDKLFIDVGMKADEVKKRVRVGDPITFGVGFEKFGDGLAVSRAFDDKMGAWIAARVLEEVKKAGGAPGDLDRGSHRAGGGRPARRRHERVRRRPGRRHRRRGRPRDRLSRHRQAQARRGRAAAAGPVIARGPNINPVVFDLLVKAAEKAKVPYQIGAEPRGTGTDANAIQLSRGGKAAALVSIPLRYMHTPTEVLALTDLEAAVKLLTRFVLDLEAGHGLHAVASDRHAMLAGRP